MEHIQSIRELASEPNSDRARALIRIYFESEWRSTRLEVLKALARFQDARSFQFLVEVIQKNEDLAEQQLAILALSHRKNSKAARFLSIYYGRAPETLKAHVAYALGQVQDEASIPKLLADFDLALSQQNYFWLRNILLAVGELKVFSVLPKIRRLLSEQTVSDTSVLMAALFALGRLERDSAFLVSQEHKFFEDSLLYQIFQSALSQTQVRSQFKLEDYLSKIFTLPEPHPVLPLELRAFDESEVEAGLELFEISAHWKRILFAVKGLKPEKRVFYYENILNFIRAQSEQLAATSQPSSGHEKLFWSTIQYDNANPVVLAWAFQKGPAADYLHWLEFVAPVVDWKKEMPKLFSVQTPEGDAIAIQAINIWSDWALTQEKSDLAGLLQLWFKEKMNASVRGRLLRASGELEVGSAEITKLLLQDLEVQELRASVLVALENSGPVDAEKLFKIVSAWNAAECSQHAARILTVVKTASEKEVAPFLKVCAENPAVELNVALLKFLRLNPYPSFENLVIDWSSHQNETVELNAIITLKNYSSTVASEALLSKLQSQSSVVKGRALDSLCAHATLVAKTAVIEYLKKNLQDEFVVDKIYRCFDPQKKGGPAFAQEIEKILQSNPDHPQWEKLVQLRDRLKVSPPEEKKTSASASAAGKTEQKSEMLKEVDQSLIQVIPQFLKLDAMAQSALRAAEEPFRATEEMRNLPIDKAPTVLEYCKALDLILEKYLGQKVLFPKLDTSLHEFQTVWHKIGFIEDYPSAEKVMTALGVKGKMDPDHFPLHKAKMMAATFFNGKIVQDRFKVFDGLRAWAVIFLVFARKLPSATGGGAPLLKLPNASDEECISVAKRLMVLQDLRNPAAHRQTYTDINTVTMFRTEAIKLLNTILKFYD